MTGTVYWPLLGAAIVAGIVPAVYFLATWRPRVPWSPRTIDAGGWVAVVLALYLLAAFRAVAGLYVLPPTLWQALPGLLIAAAVDVLLWIRVARWRRFRREAGHPLRRRGDLSA